MMLLIFLIFMRAYQPYEQVKVCRSAESVFEMMAINWTLCDIPQEISFASNDPNVFFVFTGSSMGKRTGDLNKDGCVNILDFGLLSANTIKYGIIFPEKPLDEGPPITLLEVIYELYSEME